MFRSSISFRGHFKEWVSAHRMSILRGTLSGEAGIKAHPRPHAISLSPVAVSCEERPRFDSLSAMTDGKPWTSAASVHERFEVQAHRRPDAIALRSADRTWTYRELNSRSNQLA